MSNHQWNLRILGERFAEPGEVPGRTPDFAIIGAAKAGTSALAIHLAEHPSVFMVPMKEIHFFDRYLDRGTEWYRAQFGAAPAETIAGEATPVYLGDPETPARMAAIMPDAKLIALLREPVDRAYSHYWMHRAKRPDTAEFEDLARREIEGASRPPGHPDYLALGRYVDQLEVLVRHFPRESVLVLLYEDFRAEPRQIFSEVCRFLGIDDTFEPQSLGQVINPTRRARSERMRRLMLRFKLGQRLPVGLVRWLDERNRIEGYPPIDPGLERELREWYAEPNARLAAFLGRDLSTWERPGSAGSSGSGASRSGAIG